MRPAESATRVSRDKCDVAINWAGDLHHAKKQILSCQWSYKISWHSIFTNTVLHVSYLAFLSYSGKGSYSKCYSVVVLIFEKDQISYKSPIHRHWRLSRRWSVGGLLYHRSSHDSQFSKIWRAFSRNWWIASAYLILLCCWDILTSIRTYNRQREILLVEFSTSWWSLGRQL